eukprot:scaffold1850_cov194-Pinguiococcus_pyrenoidosus.AAC.60
MGHTCIFIVNANGACGGLDEEVLSRERKSCEALSRQLELVELLPRSCRQDLGTAFPGHRAQRGEIAIQRVHDAAEVAGGERRGGQAEPTPHLHGARADPLALGELLDGPLHNREDHLSFAFLGSARPARERPQPIPAVKALEHMFFVSGSVPL